MERGGVSCGVKCFDRLCRTFWGGCGRVAVTDVSAGRCGAVLARPRGAVWFFRESAVAVVRSATLRQLCCTSRAFRSGLTAAPRYFSLLVQREVTKRNTPRSSAGGASLHHRSPCRGIRRRGRRTTRPSLGSDSSACSPPANAPSRRMTGAPLDETRLPGWLLRVGEGCCSGACCVNSMKALTGWPNPAFRRRLHLGNLPIRSTLAGL